MSPLHAFLLALALSVVPSLLFVGLLHGLRRMQNTAMMGVLSDRSGVEAREVTFADAVRGVMGLQSDYTERPSTGEYRF